MFELPEYLVLASQIRSELLGKKLRRASTKNVEHRFVWHNLEPGDFAAAAQGRTIGQPRVRGKWMSVPLEPGYVLLIGECGGDLRYEASAASAPRSYHLLIEFEDGSALWARTGMWGAYELYKAGEEL
ncbi:MAG TPA: DNA-formamidopyrimidine glycosylase family protein, partial [Rectinemataceae bacterium]|nr:DNA-formamidopyrimidine glycosylase family protein [Rectinemataceae bacterium]